MVSKALAKPATMATASMKTPARTPVNKRPAAMELFAKT
jgi:hypothetical protein